MSQYTHEQIEACIVAYRAGDLNYCRAGIIDLLTAYAATLRAEAFATVAVSKPCPACGSRSPCADAEACGSATLRQPAARVDEGMVERAQIIYALERAQRRLEDQAYRAEGYDASFPAEDAARMKEAITLLQVALVDDCYSRDLRHLVYLDTQFNMRGETDLKLPELRSLEDRGWIAEGDYNGEYVLTEAGERFVEAALSAQPAPERQGAVGYCHINDAEKMAARKVDPNYNFTGVEVWNRQSEFYCVPIYLHPAAPVGVPDGWKLVPVMATEEMRQAGAPNCGYEEDEAYALDDVWEAMLAAAPSAPQGTQQGEG